MRTIFFGVYAFGALLSAVSMLLLEPAAAAMIVVVTPMAAMWVAERFGWVQFHHIDIEHNVEQWANGFMAKAAREGLSDEEALEKYGQAIINEVSDRISHAEAQVAEMKRNRNEMIRIMQEERQ